MPSSAEHCAADCAFQTVPATAADSEIAILEEAIVALHCNELHLPMRSEAGFERIVHEHGLSHERIIAARACAAKIFFSKCPLHVFAPDGSGFGGELSEPNDQSGHK